MTDERRVVTVLFADVTGSTALGEALDPEDLRALLGRYYGIAKDVVAAHGGTVEKFIGDAVMAVFGLRRAHGDDAVRALSAALELRDRVRSDPRLGERMPIRLGVNTGDVVASRDQSSDDFLVTGDAVNVAARLQQGAAPWSILAGQRTVRAAHGQFKFGPQQPLDAKGKTEPVMACEVVAQASAMASRTPIFGRDADLAQLDLVARRAFDERRPFLVSVIAPAGTGKTRLLEEFLAHLTEIEPNAAVAVAQCLPYGQQLTYWPLRAVLFRLIGIDEDAPAAEVRAAISRWLAAAQVEDAEQVGELLASTVGAGEAEALDRNALFAAWRTFIETASQRAPLVVAVEDLHWSSDTLLDLFESVLQPRGDTRALLICLARPELLDRRPGWGGGRRNNVSIALEPLDNRSTRQLVEALAEGAPAVLVDAIVERAEGNPFFAGEIVGNVLEQVATFDDPAEIEDALERLPDTVQATVLARLDALPDDEREVLRVGSVFGRSFRPAGVAALLGRSDDIDSTVNTAEQLADRDLIRPSGADGYTFRHILIREVAYSTLPRTARATLHGAAGGWLEERAAGREEALAELVAYHFREAASLASAMDLDEAPDLRDKARVWLLRAAEVARAAAATIEAREHVLAALDFARPDDLPELYELLGEVDIGGERKIDAYSKALDLGQAAGRPATFQLRVLAKRLLVETRSQGSVARRPSAAQLQELRDEGRRLLSETDDVEARALFMAAEGFYPFWAHARGGQADAGMFAAAERDAQAALELAISLGDLNLQSAALDALGSVAQGRGQWPLAVELGERRIAMGSRLDLLEQIDAHSVASWAAIVMGDLATADRISAAGLAVIQPGQAPDWTLHLIAWRVLALELLGKWDEVEALAERARALWLEVGRPAAGYALRGFIAATIVARARRDMTRSERWSEVIDEISSSFDTRRRQFAALLAWDAAELAEGLAVPEELEAVMGILEAAAMLFSICTDAGVTVEQAALERMLAEARRLNARIAEAEALRAVGLARRDRSALAEARAIYAASGARPYEARATAELAVLTGEREELEQALAYLESIGDRNQVEHYLRLAAQ